MKKEKTAVVCETCKKEYTLLFSLETNQAYGCASDLVEKDGHIVSYSHYGSRHDTSKFDFKEHGDYQLGTICDDCIDKAVQSYIAQEDSEFSYFK